MSMGEGLRGLDEEEGEREDDVRFRGTGLPFGIPSLWTSYLRLRGKLDRLRAGSSLLFLRSKRFVSWVIDLEKRKYILNRPPW